MKEANREIHADLIEKCKMGDRNARYRLYHHYSKAMYNICIRLVQNREDAEDILQESFISAFENLVNFEGRSSFGTWIKQIVINRSLNFLKKKKILYSEIHKEIPDPEREDTAGPDIPPERIHHAIKQLPQGARLILNLRLLENYKHKEIAALLGISESTSKSQYTRAIALLQQKLLKNED